MRGTPEVFCSRGKMASGMHLWYIVQPMVDVQTMQTDAQAPVRTGSTAASGQSNIALKPGMVTEPSAVNSTVMAEPLPVTASDV